MSGILVIVCLVCSHFITTSTGSLPDVKSQQQRTFSRSWRRQLRLRNYWSRDRVTLLESLLVANQNKEKITSHGVAWELVVF